MAGARCYCGSFRDIGAPCRFILASKARGMVRRCSEREGNACVSVTLWLALLGALNVVAPLVSHDASSSWFSPVEFIVGTVCSVGFKVLFFRIAFANIDRETRKLFYAHLSGIAGYMALTNSFISFAYSGIVSAGTTLTDVSGGTLQMLAHSFLFLLIAAVVSLLLLVIGYQYLIRTLKVYE